MNACTIVSRRELARARVLEATLREHHPDGALTVLLLDVDPRRVGEIGRARLLGLEEVAGELGGLLAAANPPGALAMAVLPHLARSLLEGGAESVLYLGPGQRVLRPLDAMTALLANHQIVLVARARVQESSSGAFGERTRGVFSSELLGIAAGPASSALLSVWPRYFAEARDDGSAAVQAWLDGIPALSEDVGVLRGPAHGADPWTLANLSVDVGRDALAIGEEPMLTFDFSQMSPQAPLLLFDGADRLGPSSAPALAALCVRHAEDLLAAGYEQDPTGPAPFTELQGGVRLTATMRRLLVEGIRTGELEHSPFAAAGRQAFLEYLAEPVDRGGAAGLTRLHMAIWDDRPDLRSGYPHIDGPDGSGYAGWLCRHGQEQEGLNAALLPPVPEGAFRDADPLVHLDPPRWGVNVAGFFTAELGVGEAARLLIAGLDARGIPALPIQGHLIPPSRQGVEFSFARPDEAAYPINIVCINGDGIPVFAREAGRAFFKDRHTIATWWWEVGEPPPGWARAFEYLDEVWVSSQHVYELVAPISPVPVIKMTMPVLPPVVADRSRADLGLPDDGFLFLFVHDYHSVAARKNPAGTIEAFKRAFASGSGAKLVIKSINAPKLPDEHDRIVLAASGHPDITLIDEYVSVEEKNAMIAHCDCYVSLHRSEGFGLTVAEAMLLGKPVIATRYGGTMEFTNDQNSYLVDWRPAAVGAHAGVYPPNAVWAEPDLEMASTLMRHVFTHPTEGRKRGELARRQVSEAHAPAVAGELMERRLRRIYQRMVDEGVRTLNPRHVPASEAGANHPAEVGHLPQLEWGSGWKEGLRQRANRPVTEWSRAYVEHQRSIEAHLFERLASLDARVREVTRTLSEQHQAHHAETLAVLRGLEAELAELRGQEPATHPGDSDGPPRAGQPGERQGDSRGA